MLVSVNSKHSALIDKLVFIAGSLDLVIEATWANARDGTADLKEVVAYIIKNRPALTSVQHHEEGK